MPAKMEVGESEVDKSKVGELEVGESEVDKSEVGELEVGKLQVGEPDIGQFTFMMQSTRMIERQIHHLFV